MTQELDPNIASFFAAYNARDYEALLGCFSQDGAVSDEGHDYLGRDEIKSWAEQTHTKYNAVLEPLEHTAAGSGVDVLSEVSGTFDGSPIRVHFHFSLRDGEVASLSIT